MRLMPVQMKLVFIAVVTTVLMGCASGSALVTGQVRPAIEDINTVTILTEMPERAEEIALVKGFSDSGITQQRKLDSAVGELKEQAAMLGANAVVITDFDTLAETRTEIVEGIAVYVE
jgi:type IV pilus biogenesis protein CpaD/CtpE